MSDHVNMALSPAKCQTAYNIEKPAMREKISMRALNHEHVVGV